MDDESIQKTSGGAAAAAAAAAGGGEQAVVDVRKREYNEPTLEDKFDRSALPKVMQVKKFGFSGRTKYTHLTDQDTTNYDNPMNGWMHRSEGIDKYSQKMSGVGDINTDGRKRPRPGQ